MDTIFKLFKYRNAVSRLKNARERIVCKEGKMISQHVEIDNILPISSNRVRINWRQLIFIMVLLPMVNVLTFIFLPILLLPNMYD